MSKKIHASLSGTPRLVDPAPWKGDALFACLKCQRKMKKTKGHKVLRKIKKWFRKRSAKGAGGSPISVIGVPCVAVCPKGGVTIFSARRITQQRPEVCIARSKADLERIYCELTETALFPENETLK